MSCSLNKLLHSLDLCFKLHFLRLVNGRDNLKWNLHSQIRDLSSLLQHLKRIVSASLRFRVEDFAICLGFFVAVFRFSICHVSVLKESELDALTLRLSFQLFLSSSCCVKYQPDFTSPVLYVILPASAACLFINFILEMHELGNFAVRKLHG